MAIQNVTIGDDGTVQQAVILLPAATQIGGSSVVALGTITSTSATAFAVGRQGATAPVLNINANTASVVTGITLVGAAAAAGMQITTTSSGTDEALKIDAKGAGSLTLNGTATGKVILGSLANIKSIAAPVAATGAAGGVAGAAALGAANVVYVSSDGATKGVKFATGALGDWKWVLNTSATACNLFAASGGTINGGSADAGCTILASKGVLAFCSAANTWTVFDMTAHAGAAA